MHACLQAKSQGNSEVIDRLEVRRRLMELQQRLVAELEASSSNVPVHTCPLFTSSLELRNKLLDQRRLNVTSCNSSAQTILSRPSLLVIV